MACEFNSQHPLILFDDGVVVKLRKKEQNRAKNILWIG